MDCTLHDTALKNWQLCNSNLITDWETSVQGGELIVYSINIAQLLPDEASSAETVTLETNV